MKKIFFLFFAIMTFLASFAQLDSTHLTFKGVPIDGTLDEFVQKMNQKGFTTQDLQDGKAILKGDFAGYKDCSVGVSTLKDKDLVCKILVVFPDFKTWSGLEENYFSLKEMLSEKYGKPISALEKYDSYSEPRDDGTKMNYVKLNRCKYVTIFETQKGRICLFIDHEDMEACFVVLEYSDIINGKIVRSQAIDDL